MSFIDYRKSAASEVDQEKVEMKSKKSQRRAVAVLPEGINSNNGDYEDGGKAYENYSTKDLENAAQDNYEHPLGDYMTDPGIIANKEGNEEGYINETRRRDHPFGNGNREQDIGVSASRSRSRPEDDGYYAPSNAAYFHSTKPSTLNYDPSDRHFLHDHNVPLYPTQSFFHRIILEINQTLSFLSTLMGFNILVVISIVAYMGNKMNPWHKVPARAKVEKEWEERISGERYSSRAEYYANYFGYECEDIDVETEDGFVLRMHHLTSKKHKSLGHPVILQHGILANSVTFMVNEERSLAFFLLEQGYDVYCSNIRTNFEMPHRTYPRSDPRYWSWGIKEIGIYDLPAIVSYVHRQTNLKPTYIGHSQGTGTMFLALSRGMRPDIGNMLSGFVALGPAVYAGTVFRTFPFSFIRLFKSRKVWSLIFGVREFIPIISILQATLPSWLFGHFAFVTFAFIFGFHDHNWINRQIPKFFRTVGVATSSELLYYYMSNLSYNNCIFDTRESEPWFPASFPPLAIFYGTLDTLVLGKPLVERFRERERDVRLVKVVALDGYEHLDMIWGVNSVQECFLGVRDFIEETKDGYPDIVEFRDANSTAPSRNRSTKSSRSRVGKY